MLQVNMSVTSAAMFEKVSAAFSPTATAELNATGNDSLWSDSNVTFGSDPTREFVYNYSLYECLTHRTGYVSVDVALLLHVCLSTVAVVVGLVGNSLSIRVFSPQLNENSSSNVYMLVLAISDNFYLVAVMLREVLPHYGCLSGARVLHVVNRSELLCRTLSFATSFFSNFSTLIILAFTFERFYAGYYSANFHQYMNSSRARTCCVVMLLLVLVLTAPYHLTLMGVQHDVMCSVHEDYELLFFKLYAAEIFLFKILPVILIIIFNVFISVKICEQARNRRVRREKIKQRAETRELQSLTTQHTSCESSTSNGEARRTCANHSETKHLHITGTLFIVSTSYVVLYLPVLIHFVLWGVSVHREASIIRFDRMLVLEYVSSALYICGFAINFFLYTISGPQFRDKLFAMLCERRRPTTHIYQPTRAHRPRPATVESLHENAKTTETQM